MLECVDGLSCLTYGALASNISFAMSTTAIGIIVLVHIIPRKEEFRCEARRVTQ